MEHMEENMVQRIGYPLPVDERSGRVDSSRSTSDHLMFSVECQAEERNLATGISIYKF